MGTTEGFSAGKYSNPLVALCIEKRTESTINHGGTLGLFSALNLGCSCERKVGTITEGLAWGQKVTQSVNE